MPREYRYMRGNFPLIEQASRRLPAEALNERRILIAKEKTAKAS